jgi:uncharacterized protein
VPPCEEEVTVSSKNSGPDRSRGVPTAPSTLQRWFPIGAWLPNYDWGKFFAADLIAAVSVAALLIPESMGYSSVAGVPVQIDKVMRGLRLLQKHGVEYNIVTTVNRVNGDHPLEVYRFLRDEAGTEWMQFIPVIERVDEHGQPAHLRGEYASERSVQPEQFGQFLIIIYDEWVRQDVGRVFMQTFEAATRNWLGHNSSGMCVFNETCGHGLALEHTGDLYSCDHFVDEEFLLGNVADTNMGDLVASDRQHRFGQEKRDGLPQFCLDCEVRFACHGECPKNRFLVTPDGEPGLNYLCAGFKEFFHHIEHPMNVITTAVSSGSQRRT